MRQLDYVKYISTILTTLALTICIYCTSNIVSPVHRKRKISILFLVYLGGRRDHGQPDVLALRPCAHCHPLREGRPVAARAGALHRPLRYQARRGPHPPAQRRYNVLIDRICGQLNYIPTKVH